MLAALVVARTALCGMLFMASSVWPVVMLGIDAPHHQKPGNADARDKQDGAGRLIGGLFAFL